MPTTVKYLITPDPVGDALIYGPEYGGYYVNTTEFADDQGRDITVSDEIIKIEYSGNFPGGIVAEPGGIILRTLFTTSQTNYLELKPRDDVPFHGYVWANAIKIQANQSAGAATLQTEWTIIRDLGIENQSSSFSTEVITQRKCDTINCMIKANGGNGIASTNTGTTPLGYANSNTDGTVIFSTAQAARGYDDVANLLSRVHNCLSVGFAYNYDQGNVFSDDWLNNAGVGSGTQAFLQGSNGATWDNADYNAADDNSTPPGVLSIRNLDPDFIFVEGTLAEALAAEDFRLRSDSILAGAGDGVSGQNIGPDLAYDSGPSVADIFTGIGRIVDQTQVTRSAADTFSGVGQILDIPQSERITADQFLGVGAITDTSGRIAKVIDQFTGRGRTTDTTSGTHAATDTITGIGLITDSGVGRIGDDVILSDDFFGVGRITDQVTTTSFTADVITGVGTIADAYQKQVIVTDQFLGVGSISDIAIKAGEEPQAPILESTGRYNQVIGSVGIWDPDI